MAKKKNWIKNAVPKERRGVFKAKAEAAGETTAEFARKHARDSGKLGNEARLAQTLMGMNKGGKKKSRRETLYDHERSRRHG